MPEPDANDTVTNPANGPAVPDNAEPAAGPRVEAAKPAEAQAPEPAERAVEPSGADAQLAAAKAEAAANYERFVRTAADLENFRRRTVRERDDLRATVTGRLLEDIFPVLDNLALAISAAKQPKADLKSLIGGIEMVLAQLKAALGSHGVKEINPVGQPFDPHQHEAISHLPSADVKAEHVVAVVRTGYAIDSRLLRPASVVVSSGPAGEGQGS